MEDYWIKSQLQQGAVLQCSLQLLIHGDAEETSLCVCVSPAVSYSEPSDHHYVHSGLRLPYLVTRDKKSCPDEKTRYGLSSGGHEEKWLLGSDHRGLGYKGRVGHLGGRSGRRARGEADRRVIP